MRRALSVLTLYLLTFWSRLAARLLNVTLGRRPTWRELLRWGAAPMLAYGIGGGAGETTATFTTALKEFYPSGGISDQLNVDTYLLDKVEAAKDIINVEGRYWYRPTRFGLAGAAGPRGESVALPSAGSQTLDDIQVLQRFHYGVIEVSGPSMAASRSDRGAFKRVLKFAMDGMYEEVRFTLNVLLHGYETAVMGEALSVAASVITVKDNILPVNWFKVGLKIDSYVGSTNTVRQAGMRITSVNLALREITVDTIGATAANDRLYLAGSKDVAPSGLLATVDAGDYKAVHFNIDRTAAGRGDWKSYVKSASGQAFATFGSATRAPLNEILLQAALDEQRVRAGGSRGVDLFYSSLGVRRSFFAALDPDRRYNSGIYDGGWKALKYENGDDMITWVGDEHGLRYTAFGLATGAAPNNKGGVGRPSKVTNEEWLALFQGIEPEWDESTGGQLKQVYSGAALVDAVTAFWKWYLNWGGTRPNVHLRIDDITEPS